MGSGSSKDKVEPTKNTNNGAGSKSGGGGGNRKPMTNTNMDIGKDGPTQVIIQTFAPAGAPAVYHGTVRARPNFQASQEAEKLHKAMDGAGTKDNAVIDVLTSCNNEQRQLIAQAYKQKYGKDLIKVLKSELSGDYEDVVVHLVEPSAEYEAWLMNEAISGLGTEEDVLIEILSFRNKTQLEGVRKAYKNKFGKTLAEDIDSDTSGNFQKLLLKLMKEDRDEPHVVVESFAKSDARFLHQEGEDRLGTDDDFFMSVFTSRSWDQLAAACKAYEEIYGKTMEDALGKEFSGDILYGLKKLVAFSRDRAVYFADKLHEAMSGMGTDDETLQRIIITHCEVDMLEIKEAYRNKYSKTLGNMIRDDCSGNYKNILLALIN
ncbi:annexin A13-like [Amphiura filiformis]|uniref:annexin A13-like n=1 Tax=Amphiura filiformis TaxID=82378 RepID=UPI003B21960B